MKPNELDDYYKYAPFPGGRIVDRVQVQGAEQPWSSNTVRYVNRRWVGPVHIRAQGIEFYIRYVGIHEHVDSGRYPMHTHPHSEFIFTLSGNGSIDIPDRKMVESCEPGHLVVTPPGRVHGSRWSVRKGDEPWRIMVVNFDIVVDVAQVLIESGERVDLAFSPFHEWFFLREGAGFKMTGPERDAVMVIMNEIVQSLNTREYGICSEIIAGLIRCVSSFSRHIRKKGLADGTLMAPPVISKDAVLLRARSLMEHGGVLDTGCVARVANTIGMSESHFIREFKRIYGTTPKQYSLEVIMRRAGALLRGTDITVKDASYHLGYLDPSTFSRAFTKYYGVSPKEFQKQAVV